jgi:NitT/TauT family transport system ATP-binding protein
LEINKYLKLEHVTKSFGDLNVLYNFSVEFVPGRLNCILGPSGCGKTTLLNLIAGITAPDQLGTNNFENRRISYIFQEDRLLPWKTVKENIRFVLHMHFSGEEMESTIARNIKLIELENFQDYYPMQLSGGMKRRVSIARAFSYPSEVVLLDEPFKGIDISLKQSLMLSLRMLWENEHRTLIYVTHDIDEAVLMGHRIYVLSTRPARVIGHFDQLENPGPGRALSPSENELKEKIRRLLIPAL